MLAQVSHDLPSETSSNFPKIFSQDAANSQRDEPPLSRENKPHGNPVPAETPPKSSRKESAKIQKPHKASSIVSKSDMPSAASAQRKTFKPHPQGSKSDAQRRPTSSGCSRSRSQQPRARRGPTRRSQAWAEAHNPPPPPPSSPPASSTLPRSPSTTSVTSFRSAHSSLSTSPGESSSSPPSLPDITSALQRALDSLIAFVTTQEARISDLTSRLSALETNSSTTSCVAQPVQDQASLCSPPNPSPCSDQRGPVLVSPPPSTPDPSPCSDQRGPIPPTTCSTAVQAGFTTSNFECTLDGTSATSPATSSPDTCDSSTQVRYSRLPASPSPNLIALHTLAATLSSVEKDDEFFTDPFSINFADVISHISATWRKYSTSDDGVKFNAEVFQPNVDGKVCYEYGGVILWFFLNSLGFSSLSACKDYKLPPSARDVIQRYPTPTPPSSSSTSTD